MKATNLKNEDVIKSLHGVITDSKVNVETSE